MTKQKRQTWLRIRRDLKRGSRDVTWGRRQRLLTQKGSSGPHSFSIAVAAGHRGNHGGAAYLFSQVEPFLADQRRCSFASEQPLLSVTCRKDRQLGSLRPDTQRGLELRQEKKHGHGPLVAPRGDTKSTGDGQEELFRLKDVVTRRRGVYATGHAPSFSSISLSIT